MGLSVREILAAVIGLRQFHSDVGNERRARVFPKKFGRCCEDFGRIGIRRGVLHPDREIIGSLASGGLWLARSGFLEIFSGVIETRRSRVKGQFGEGDPRLSGAL